jgi:hypothetical protein
MSLLMRLRTNFPQLLGGPGQRKTSIRPLLLIKVYHQKRSVIALLRPGFGRGVVKEAYLSLYISCLLHIILFNLILGVPTFLRLVATKYALILTYT